MERDEVGDAEIDVEIGEGEIVEDFGMGADGVSKSDVFDESGLFQDIAGGVGLVDAPVKDREGEGVTVAEEHQRRHGEGLVDGAGDAGEGRARVGTGGKLGGKEEVRMDARAVHRGGVAEEFVLGGQFGIGELEEKVERGKRLQGGALAFGQGALLVELLAKLGDGGERKVAFGLVAQGGEETAGGIGQRVAGKIEESGFDERAAVDTGGGHEAEKGEAGD